MVQMSKEFSISYCFEPIYVITWSTLWSPSCTVHTTDLKLVVDLRHFMRQDWKKCIKMA